MKPAGAAARSKAIPFDTTPEAHAIQIGILRRIGIEGRARMTFELCDWGRAARRDWPGATASAEDAARGAQPVSEDGEETMSDSLQDFLSVVVGRLEDVGIPYMIAGSLASGVYGEARASYDVDIVFEADVSRLGRFLRSLGEGFYFSEADARRALREQGMFNVIDQRTGWKADLIVRRSRPFGLSEFSRRRRAKMLGLSLFLVSPEDAILSKLEWAKAGESERQFRDALGVATVQGEALDHGYLERWARELGVEDLLERLFREAGKE